MKVLITGAAGFGGSGLIKELLKHGHKIRAIDMIAPNHADNLRKEIDSGQIEYVWMNCLDLAPEDVDGYDIICHFAAQGDVPMGFTSPKWTLEDNVMGTVAVLEAVRQTGCDRLIIPSSGNVFGRPPEDGSLINESYAPTCHNVYSASKATQENLAWAYYRSYNVPVVIYRNGIVYGPGMRRNIFIYIWLKNLLQDKPIVIEGGDQTRDPCYVTDTVDAWLKGIEAPREKVIGEAFQVSRGQEYSIYEIAAKCIHVVGYNGQPAIIRDYRPGEKGMRECFDITKAKTVLGYDPKISLDEGLQLTMDWVKTTLL